LIPNCEQYVTTFVSLVSRLNAVFENHSKYNRQFAGGKSISGDSFATHGPVVVGVGTENGNTFATVVNELQ
jgi:hypothetical protein